ncbi:MAG: ABC transporter ATP-binding protein [Actinomycetota bacterium]|nr:ABC transporter ATP-binding protein [Euzebyaceae bacterium]MDQ3452903.1 ABC transporter ATP-binding protein [Actinomycetota bacterium]
MTPPPVVEATDVTRSYTLGKGADAAVVHALRGVSFAVRPAELVAIIGPSGSGKSTLLHLLGALDRPTTGRLRFFGRPVDEMNDAELARLRNTEIGFVFQQFQLLTRTSALANVALPLVYRGTPRAERRERAVAALRSVGLGHRLDHRPSQLSGGEQQRVAVARALVSQPRLLLADEPTGNLDTVTGQEIMDLLRELNRERGVAVVVITHDPEIAALTPRQIRIRDGVLEGAAVTPAGPVAREQPVSPVAARRERGA